MTTTTFNRATFANICKAYGFVEKYNCLYWGRGSLVWGREAYVKYCGDAVEIEFHKWQYNCDMDAEFDDTAQPLFLTSLIFSKIASSIALLMLRFSG